MSASEDVVVDVSGLGRRYGTTDVVRDVTFQIHRGEVVALLGPNGAGKTTTIEILEASGCARPAGPRCWAPTQRTAASNGGDPSRLSGLTRHPRCAAVPGGVVGLPGPSG